MCVYSMIADHYLQKPAIERVISWPNDKIATNFDLGISRQEFEKLKEEVRELKILLEKAEQYDRDNNQPECEDKIKREMIEKIMKALDE